MSDKKYWTSFAALNHKDEIQKLTQNEFSEDLPFEDIDDKGLLEAKTPRRDFLKYLGFSTAAATIAFKRHWLQDTLPGLDSAQYKVLYEVMKKSMQ